jgi:hypothetical protein
VRLASVIAATNAASPRSEGVVFLGVPLCRASDGD